MKTSASVDDTLSSARFSKLLEDINKEMVDDYVNAQAKNFFSDSDTGINLSSINKQFISNQADLDTAFTTLKPSLDPSATPSPGASGASGPTTKPPHKTPLTFTLTNLPHNADEESLKSYLEIFGNVKSVTLNSEQHTATVEFVSFKASSSSDVFLATPHKYMGAQITVSRADAATPLTSDENKDFNVGFTIIEDSSPSDTKRFKVDSVDSESDAGKKNEKGASKIHVGDYITEIDNTSITDKTLSEVRDMLKGEQNSKVRITFSYLGTDGKRLIYYATVIRDIDSKKGVTVGGSAYSTHAVSNISQKNRSMTNSNGKGKRKGKGKNKSKKQNATKKLNRY